MNNFKEYIDREILEDLFVESMFDIMTAPVRIIGGSATNLGYQATRGAGNFFKGLGKSVKGAAKIGTGSLQAISGDPKRGFKSVSSGAADVLSGAVGGAKGAAQVIASPASALVRGVQAATEPMRIEPIDDKRNKLQNFFGLNSWRTPEEKSKEQMKDFEFLMRKYVGAKEQKEKKEIMSQIKEIDNPVVQERLKNLIKRANALKVAHFAAKAAEKQKIAS